jgi:hypothetical protein
MVCIDSFNLQTMTAFNKKFLQGVQMLHGAVFSKSAPLAAGGYAISWQYGPGNYPMDWLPMYSMILSNQ